MIAGETGIFGVDLGSGGHCGVVTYMGLIPAQAVLQAVSASSHAVSDIMRPSTL